MDATMDVTSVSERNVFFDLGMAGPEPGPLSGEPFAGGEGAGAGYLDTSGHGGVMDDLTGRGGGDACGGGGGKGRGWKIMDFAARYIWPEK